MAQGYPVSKRQPLREIVGKDSERQPPVVLRSSRGNIAFPAINLRLDVLSCGHKIGSEFLKSKSKTPYLFKEDGTVWRKCKKCPREAS